MDGASPEMFFSFPVIFEGFKPNGLQIRNQCIFLHIIACVKIDFGVFWEMSSFSMVPMTFGDIR